MNLYYKYRPNIAAALLSDLIVGFLKSIIYWEIEDHFYLYYIKYNTNEINDIILLLFSLLESCSLKKSESFFRRKQLVFLKYLLIDI